MATGDAYFNCENKETDINQAFRKMIYDDGNGNPVLNINPNGSTLAPFFKCDKSNVTIDQVLRLLIVKDENNLPVFNIAKT